MKLQAALFIEKNTLLCIHTESCVKEKLQHNNNKVEFVFPCTDEHPSCELVVVPPTPPTFAATTSAIQLSRTTAALLFFNFTQKL